jgi:hypothetical protein
LVVPLLFVSLHAALLLCCSVNAVHLFRGAFLHEPAFRTRVEDLSFIFIARKFLLLPVVRGGLGDCGSYRARSVFRLTGFVALFFVDVAECISSRFVSSNACL